MMMTTTTIIQLNSIQFNSLLLVCCINSQKANYRYSTTEQNNKGEGKVVPLHVVEVL
jgi:hypothetical protein